MTALEIAESANLTSGGLALITAEMPPSAALGALEERGLYEDAVRFLAHQLPVRGGIQWAVECARELEAPERKARPNPPLEAAGRWLLAPTDATRLEARQAADRSPEKSAATLIAMAVFFSGGSVTPPGEVEVQPPPNTPQKMVAGAVRVTVVSYDPAHSGERYRRALALGRQADSGLRAAPNFAR